MLTTYAPVGIFFGVAVVFAVVPLIVGWLFRPKNPDWVKMSPYESGVRPFGPAQIQFRTRYYLLALVFVVFDVEAIILLPWVVGFRDLGLEAHLAVAIFVALILVGYVYDLGKRVLEWL